MYQHTIHPRRLKYKAHKFMGFACACGGVLFVFMNMINRWNVPVGVTMIPFGLSVFYFAMLHFHGVTVCVSSNDITESWMGKKTRYLVADISEPSIVRLNESFHRVQFELQDGTTAQIRTDEPEELLTAIEHVLRRISM